MIPSRGLISHLGKRKIIFKMPFLGDMLVPWRVIVYGESMNQQTMTAGIKFMNLSDGESCDCIS